jgi:OOP family OmpA-OmpF porin
MKLIAKLVVAAFAASAAVTAGAQEPAHPGYLVDGSGKVVMSGGGLCWHTSSWTPEMAIEPCDARIKPVAAYVAPVPEATPTPAPALAPEPVAAAPAPVEPVVVAAPPPPPPQAISFTGDALFAFDKSELRPEGKAMLEDLISRLQGVTFDRINVTGHSDRIGSKDYNQQLSERRATTVKDYLVGKDVASGRIDAQGMGNSQPTVASDDCRNTQGSKETIACLQPDRRVDIEMTGTKMILGSR